MDKAQTRDQNGSHKFDGWSDNIFFEQVEWSYERKKQGKNDPSSKEKIIYKQLEIESDLGRIKTI
jgi:hypothetical protein